MNGILEHPLVLLIVKAGPVDDPRVRVRHFVHLVVESIGEGVLNLVDTASTCRVRYDANLIEARILHILVPDPERMVGHVTAVRDSNSRLGVAVEVRIHD